MSASEDFHMALEVERHDQRHCERCGFLFDRSELHDGLCDWCTDEEDL